MPTNERRCGDCQLCCKLLPTPEIGSPANTRCQHQKHGVGCAIYAKRPMSCQLWSCAWLNDDNTADLPRPDRAHYVVDTVPDYITVTHNEGGEPEHIPVIQVWVDPDHRTAHRAPSFRRWLDHIGMPAIIRFNAEDGFVLLPPSVTGGQWIEKQSAMRTTTHTIEQKMAALGGKLSVELSPNENGACKATLDVGGRRFEIATMGMDDRQQALAALLDARAMAERNR